MAAEASGRAAVSTQAEILAALNALPTPEARAQFVMQLSTTQKAILNWGDDYGPKVNP